MAEVSLQGARVVSLACQRITAGVPKHVRVRLETKFSLDTRPLDHACEPGGAEGCAALRCGSEGRLRLLLTLEPPECPRLSTEDWMGVWRMPCFTRRTWGTSTEANSIWLSRAEY